MQKKKTFPDFVPPMMAHSVKEPFDSRDWIFELKLDGYRAITVFDVAGKPHLWSRNGLPLEQKFPAILKAVSRLKLPSTVLDGEIVAVDENGIPRFQLLQRFQKQPTAPTLYFVFDVLWSNGTDITGARQKHHESQLRVRPQGPHLRRCMGGTNNHLRCWNPIMKAYDQDFRSALEKRTCFIP